MARSKKYAKLTRISFSTDSQLRIQLEQELHKKEYPNLSYTINKIIQAYFSPTVLQQISRILKNDG